MNNLLMGGLLGNCILLLINRFIRHIPDFLYIPLMIVCIICMIIGVIQTNC